MKYGKHMYSDVSDLNALWDHSWAPPGYPTPPVRGLGQPPAHAFREGSLGQMSRRINGMGQPPAHAYREGVLGSGAAGVFGQPPAHAYREGSLGQPPAHAYREGSLGRGPAGTGPAGTLSGGSGCGARLHGLGAEDPAYPWKVKSGSTQRLQGDLNEMLARKKMNILLADGILAGRTCGAVKFALDNDEAVWANPSTCGDHVSEWIAPTKAAAGTPYVAPTPGPVGPVQPLQPLPVFEAGATGPNWLLIGAGVAALAIGGAIMMKKKKKSSAAA